MGANVNSYSHVAFVYINRKGGVMKYILILSMILMTACASTPHEENEHDHGLLQVKACVFDTMSLIMSVGDSKVLNDSFCHVTKEKEAIWDNKRQTPER